MQDRESHAASAGNRSWSAEYVSQSDGHVPAHKEAFARQACPAFPVANSLVVAAASQSWKTFDPRWGTMVDIRLSVVKGAKSIRSSNSDFRAMRSSSEAGHMSAILK